MIIARIDGTVTATVKHKSLEGFTMLIGQGLNERGEEVGEPWILLDKMGAGLGELVLVTSEGDSARKLTGFDTVPARMVVMGLLDGLPQVGKPAGGADR